MNRRDSLAVFGAAMLGATTPGTAAAAPAKNAPPPFDLSNPRDIARIYRRLAWIDGDGFGIWWLKGRRYVAVPPTYIPFWDMLIGSLFTIRSLDADTYAVTSMSTTFYTDIATGALLDTFHHPVTGKDVKVVPLNPKPITQQYGIHGQMLETPMNSMPGTTATRNSEPGPAFIEGDDIWLRNDVSARLVPTDVTRQALQVEDLTTYFGTLKDVANPKLREVPAGQVFTDLLNFPAWLEMGDRNGHFFSRCFGRKVFSTGAMPADWQRLMAERHPEILRDPLAALHA